MGRAPHNSSARRWKQTRQQPYDWVIPKPGRTLVATLVVVRLGEADEKRPSRLFPFALLSLREGNGPAAVVVVETESVSTILEILPFVASNPVAHSLFLVRIRLSREEA